MQFNSLSNKENNLNLCPLQIVVRSSKTQFQVGENLIYLLQLGKRDLQLQVGNSYQYLFNLYFPNDSDLIG